MQVQTSADDVEGMAAAAGVLTAVGGAASHAAVVARALGLPCVVGAHELSIHPTARLLLCGGRTLAEGDEITIDGAGGGVYAGRLPTVGAEVPQQRRLLSWVERSLV